MKFTLPKQIADGNFVITDAVRLLDLFQVAVGVRKGSAEESPQILHFIKRIGVSRHDFAVARKKGVVEGTESRKLRIAGCGAFYLR